MAQPIPSKILRNCTIYVDKENRIGQTKEITLPTIEFKKETVLNCGMVMEREVNMGVINALSVTFKELAIDADVMNLLAKEDVEFMVVGALRDADGGEPEEAVCYMRGKQLKLDFGSWSAGNVAENDYEVSVDYLKFEIDGSPVFEISDYVVKINDKTVFGYENTMLNG